MGVGSRSGPAGSCRGCHRVRLRHHRLFHRRPRTGCWAAVALLGRDLRRRGPGTPTADGFSAGRWGSRRLRPASRPRPSSAPSSITRCWRRRSGTSRSPASSRRARSASAPTASSCGSTASTARGSTRRSSVCGCRCARVRRRRSAASSSSRRGCRRRSRRCGPAATTSRATFISSASAPPASCSALSVPPTPPHAPDLAAALRHGHRRHA